MNDELKAKIKEMGKRKEEAPDLRNSGVSPDISVQELKDYIVEDTDYNQKDVEDIEAIVDNAIKEVTEIPNKEEPKEVVKEINNKEQVSNNSLYKAVLLLNGSIIQQKEKIEKLGLAVKKKWLIILITFIASLACGFGIGWNSHKYKSDLKPYLGSFLNIGGKVVEKSITKGLGE